MGLRIYNSMTHKKEEFTPIHKGQVGIYVCGPTVYNFLHVGNFRGPALFSLVANWLEKLGYKVTFVANFTDVDDKIIDRATQEGVSPSEISEKYIAEYRKDYNSLGLRKHDHNPKVTEYLPQIIQMIEGLIHRGHAYVIASGEVLYSVRSFTSYGKLSNRKPDDMLSGARVEVDAKKRDPLDFALWKPAKPGEPSWPSPWGSGRPGWHIECSAMSKALLGDTIDIHGGGSDLIFPHHENEIAQSEGCTGHTFVKYWMHNGMITFGAQKMSKSLGNIVRARDFVAEYNSEIMKYLLLQVHYRSLSDFSDEQIQSAIGGLAKVYSALALAENYSSAEGESGPEDQEMKKILVAAEEKVTEALNDDFNTPEVFAAIFEVVRNFNTLVKPGQKVKPILKARSEAFTQWIKRVGALMALYQEPATVFLRTLDDMLLVKMNVQREQVDALIAERNEARAQKNWSKSDHVRDQLLAMGIAVQDTPTGTLWEVQK